MKKPNLNKPIMMNRFTVLWAVIAIFFVFTASCSKEDSENNPSDLPTSFRVDVPSSISQNATKKDALSGELSSGEIYQHLNNFIYLGDASAELIEDIIVGIRIYGLSQPMTFTYVSEEDGRTKNVVVIDNATFEGTTWEHQLSITDAESEGNEDKGYAIQVFWNVSPIEGIAVLKPFNWDRSGVTSSEKTIFRVEYSEKADANYEAHMIVTIYGWEETVSDRFHMDNLKMFVGKNGDRIDVFGNSNHPDAWLFLQDTVGFNWAFVASGSETKNIGVAEVGLPPSSLDETSREVLLGTYSLKNVFTSQIREYIYQIYGVYPDQAALDTLLQNTDAPGYFNSGGFVQGGTAPSGNYEELTTAISTMVPYNPYTITNLSLSFKQ